MWIRYGERIKISDELMFNIATYMDDEKREKVHTELAPCTPEKFMARYLELDTEFADFLEKEFDMTYES